MRRKKISRREKSLRTISSSFIFTLFLFVISSFFLIMLSSSCRLYNLERKLDPVNAEFLSKVRYIITKEERKIFLELPDSEKEKFKEEFWKKRDPDPDTEENEFKIEYFNRIERATELFMGEGKPGWLTDRGRIYVLFGPPTDRITYPMGEDSYGRCREIWYYGNFPVVFVDDTCTGSYRLITYNLTAISSLNLNYMHELNIAQAKAQETIVGERRFFDFEWNVKKTHVSEERVEGLITIEIAYSALWFKAEDDKLRTTLKVELELLDSENTIAWEYEGSYPLETDEEELKKSARKKHRIEIPFVLDKEIERLHKGKNRLQIKITNETGGEELKKIMDFKL